jgi:predicted AAA+ superfamily ATPase
MALISAMEDGDFHSIRNNPARWGRWVESAIGAHLVNQSIEHGIQLSYWRHRNDEVDFVLSRGNKAIGIEVKSIAKSATTGMDAFQKQFKPHRVLLVGQSGIPVADFLTMEIKDLF